jgi:hypothetical protein
MIFIVGNSRSGTTMLGRVMGQHSTVHTFGELHFFEQQVSAAELAQRPQWTDADAITVLERLITTERDGFFEAVVPGRYIADARAMIEDAGNRDPVALYEAYLRAEVARCGKSIACEQTPRYLFFAREILATFPQAKVINLVRDPRDVLLSQKNKWRRRRLGASNIPRREALRAWANYHPMVIAKLWQSAVRVGQSLEADPRFMTLRFEDLVADPQAQVRALCAHTDLGYEPQMIEVPQVGSSTGRDRGDQKGISAKQAGSWRSGGVSSAEVALCEWITAREMAQYNYVPSGISKLQPGIVIDVIKLAFKAPISLVLNLMRTKNLGDTVKRRLGRG